MAPPRRRPALSPEHRQTLTVSVTDHSPAAGPRGSVCSPSAFLPVGGVGVQGEQPVLPQPWARDGKWGCHGGRAGEGRPPPGATPSLSHPFSLPLDVRGSQPTF